MDSDELDSANASLFWLDETAFKISMQSACQLRAWILQHFLATWCPAMAFRGRFSSATMPLGHVHRGHHGNSPCTSPMSTRQSFNPPCLWSRYMLPPQPRAHRASPASSEPSPYAKAQSTSRRRNGGTGPKPKWRAARLHTPQMEHFHLGPVCSSKQCSRTRRLTTGR